MKHPLHNAFEKIDNAIAKGGVTIAELKKTAKKYPRGMADMYLKSKDTK